MTPDLSFIHLITNASLLVQLVMLALLIASVVSWSMIFSKRVLLNKAKKEADRFEELFWSSEDLTPLYNRINKKRDGATGMEKLFEARITSYNVCYTKLLRSRGWRKARTCSGARKSRTPCVRS